MYCENCGKDIPDNAAFCTGCGAKVQPRQNEGMAAAPGYTPPPVGGPAPSGYPPPHPQQTAKAASGDGTVMTMGEYLVMLLLMMIPIAGIVLLFIWSFGSAAGPNKRNFARAYLIFWGIAVVLSIIFSGLIGGILASILTQTYY